MRGARALLVAVIVMAVLILLGTAVLISTVVHRTVVRRARRAPAAQTLTIPTPPLTLDQPPGTRIVSTVRLSATSLALTLTGGGLPDRVVIWDLAGNRIAATARLAP